MSLYINVEKSDLKIKRGNFKNIIYAFQELAEKNDNFEKLKGVKTIKDILDFIGIPYEYDELEDYYMIKTYSDDFYEIYDFEVALRTIAENLQENEEYTLELNCSEYNEREKYVFKNKKLIKYTQQTKWVTDIEEETILNTKKDKDIKELEGFAQREYLQELEKSSKLTEYEKLKGYLD